MAAPVSWRIKGIDKTTRALAAKAAKREGMSVGEWLERAIDRNVGIIPPEKTEPLVSSTLLESARSRTGDEKADEEAGTPDHTEEEAETSDAAPEPVTSAEQDQATLPFLAESPKARPKRVPSVSPMLMAAESRRSSSLLPRIVGGLLVVVLIVGTYWLVDQNARNRMAAESDAVASRSATLPDMAETGATGDGTAGSQAQDQQSALPADSVIMTPLERLTALANSGNGRAQQDLGLMFLEGNGVPRDPRLAAGWLEKSANSGMPNAQYQLAILYRKGLGVSPSMKSAHRWFLQAARQGHVRAQYDLATLYLEGKGTKRDYEEAALWFSRAGRAGLAEAHYSLGTIHEDGLGVERDPRRAADYYRRALAAGSARAAGKLTRLEPALKELSAAADAATLEVDVVPVKGDGPPPPAKERALSAVGIQKLQRLLKKLDIEPGPADGVLGEKTMEAIRLYQRFAGLPVDGKPTLALLLDLRQVVGAMSSEIPEAPVPVGSR